VLRKKPPGKLLPGAHAIEREYRVMEAVGRHGVPTPALHGLCQDPAILGTPFYVMSYVPGRIHKNPALPGLEPSERRAVYSAMNRTIAQIHSVDIHAAGIADYGKQEDYVARQVRTWSRQYEASRTGDCEAMERVMAWLPGNIPPQPRATVVHGDFRVGAVFPLIHPFSA
jgi:acyl-CoA dehydrogenase family protein 10